MNVHAEGAKVCENIGDWAVLGVKAKYTHASSSVIVRKLRRKARVDGDAVEEVDENEALLMPVGQKPVPKWTQGERIIPGTNIIIPWHPTVQHKGTRKGDDTAEAAVYRQTYRPSILTTWPSSPRHSRLQSSRSMRVSSQCMV